MAETARTERLGADGAGLARAAALLRAGRLVAFPTETVYGLGGDARSDRAVAGIFAAKGRPSFNPLIVHVPDLAAAGRLVDLPPAGLALAEAFWPGALTLVAPMRAEAGISPLVTAGLETLAVRVPAHSAAQALLRGFDGPVAAPSANPSGGVSPTTAAHVLDGLDGKIAAVLDGGACPVGLESTIVSLAGETPMLLRPGGVTAEALAQVLGAPIAEGAGSATQPTAPGQLASHYAPDAPVRLNATARQDGEVWLGFGPDCPGDMSLSESGELAEAAARLFAALRAMDALAEGRRIAVAPVPQTGLGAAINDRLRRAAAPRAEGED
ncbi:Sua5/YciO/YrdC/YwlC family protein [Dinoroseobacter shibae DFL 12 = DSM 16493]|jgi:L-threonylcarbamoyladenylate synthase|uniref:Threonylcarbamoyl-AMP synthase n=1 Tax=Dinoroseobacter shibae (strain DSM 16493 / NCIMB 14021 / DFL 12) TaxID=398580 RepID=A8LL68_DINSH|nr:MULTISPECIES: L-threonylcarbamoyladenylate synthase [Dinoroseobacter]ABV94817.1 Sua5/YciO/YrdC/YwlC family protein [Dinoroseobacter shibae DFL 12 = DSM 16493]MDD9716739.1 L-threonylcarbamoyladenylate synthase [Dinoroseobacter sp. PD6]URF46237.1 L-threonylcarbamoyladenylate synthase [Dinoroseobacter shibae]URF50544.1 L-threonylcarbamoyladenylate synthase [Dinoroseobacter shibae]